MFLLLPHTRWVTFSSLTGMLFSLLALDHVSKFVVHPYIVGSIYFLKFLVDYKVNLLVVLFYILHFCWQVQVALRVF